MLAEVIKNLERIKLLSENDIQSGNDHSVISYQNQTFDSVKSQLEAVGEANHVFSQECTRSSKDSYKHDSAPSCFPFIGQSMKKHERSHDGEGRKYDSSQLVIQLPQQGSPNGRETGGVVDYWEYYFPTDF